MGITCGDPFWGILQSLNEPFGFLFSFAERGGLPAVIPYGCSWANPNYSLTRFTRMVFLLLSLSQTAFGKFQKQKSPSFAEGVICRCGERGIRTPGPASRGTHAFQACQLNHSCISPCIKRKLKNCGAN